jgi:hypothetical protein
MDNRDLIAAIHTIVTSGDGVQAAVRATNAGLPAIVGVDKLLQEKLGEHYSKAGIGTQTAGWEIAQIMRNLGYTQKGRKRCPVGCAAATGQFWVLHVEPPKPEPAFSSDPDML